MIGESGAVMQPVEPVQGEMFIQNGHSLPLAREDPMLATDDDGFIHDPLDPDKPPF
jgi:hypothetical protein